MIERWAVVEGSWFLESGEGIGPTEMSEDRARLFTTLAEADEALARATKGHAKTTMRVCRVRIEEVDDG
jgi:hypothetical protein